MARVFLVFAVICAHPALAFNDLYEDGARIMQAATSQLQTAVGLRVMVDGALSSQDDNAPLVAHLLGSQATARALGYALPHAADTVRLSLPLTPESYRDALSPLLHELALLLEAPSENPEAVFRAAKAVAELDKAARDAGLPGVERLVTEAYGNAAAGAAMDKMFKSIISLGKSDTGSESLDELDKLRREKADALTSLLSPKIAPYAPLAPAVRDIVLWNARALDQSSAVLGLVEEAIRSGKFDNATYEVLREQLYSTITRGPWDTGTLTDALLGWCAQIPELGKYCADIFRQVKNLMNSAICAPIECDCDNVRGVVTYVYREECRKHELDARMQCALAQDIVTGCRHPFGPAAWPKQ